MIVICVMNVDQQQLGIVNVDTNLLVMDHVVIRATKSMLIVEDVLGAMIRVVQNSIADADIGRILPTIT